jgi:hypothetical protein
VKATPIATWATALLVLATAAFSVGQASAQEPLTVGVDADPTGNTATSLGSIDPCVSVDKGATFDIDLIVTNVEDLRGWEVYFSFDDNVVTVVDLDVEMFQAVDEGSSVFNGSQDLGSISGGLFRVGAVDIGAGSEADSGSGVLARLTLEATGSGLSPALLPLLDENEDGTIDLGPRLSDPQFEPIGDTTGDPYFDGTIVQAQIAVGMPCPAAPSPEPTPEATPTPATTSAPPSPAASPADGGTPVSTTTGTVNPTATATASPPAAATATPTSSNNSDDDGISGGLIVALVVGGSLALVLLVGAALAIARRRSS